MRCLASALVLLSAAWVAGAARSHAAARAGAAVPAVDEKRKHHHKHHRHHHGHHHRHHHGANRTEEEQANATGNLTKAPVQESAPNVTVAAENISRAGNASLPQAVAEAPDVKDAKAQEEKQIMLKMRQVTEELNAEKGKSERKMSKGKLRVNAPLPDDFQELFAKAASEATGCDPKEVKVLGSKLLPETEGKLAEVSFRAPGKDVKALLDQAADADSKFASGILCEFLVAKDENGSTGDQCKSDEPEPKASKLDKKEPAPKRSSGQAVAGNIDVDTDMPYGDLEPFGREDTAQELTESSIKESDAMVDQLERAEVAEEKRAVFRALTRLRGAAIASFDGIARSQTGVIDEYNQQHQWRGSHPLHHLAAEESDISKWAFPDSNF